MLLENKALQLPLPWLEDFYFHSYHVLVSALSAASYIDDCKETIKNSWKLKKAWLRSNKKVFGFKRPAPFQLFRSNLYKMFYVFRS